MPSPVDIRRMLEHYRAHARSLPWRETRDPYAILVSEIMLQQTRVEAVVPYYRRFLQRFPDWRSLAGASEQDLLAAWSGLGYYRRARNLQRTAHAVCERGGLPEDEPGLRELPGIGPYTAAALASLAFGRPAVALDGNAFRVWLRYLGWQADPARPATRRDLTARLLPAIPPDAAADFTQAVMEVGATICIPVGAPRCPRCPLAGGCEARRRGLADLIPPPRRKRQTERLRRAAAVLVRDGRVLLVQGQREGLLEGLWECPSVDVASGDPEALLQAWLRERGWRARLEPRGELRFGITFRDIRCEVFRGALEEQADSPGGSWVPREELAARPMPSSTRRILQLAGELAEG